MSTNGSSSPRSALKNHSRKSSAPPSGPHSKSISGQWTAIFGRPGRAPSAISSMLGCVAAGQGDRVAVAAQPGVDPEDVDRRSRRGASVDVTADLPRRYETTRGARAPASCQSPRPPRSVNECISPPVSTTPLGRRRPMMAVSLPTSITADRSEPRSSAAGGRGTSERCGRRGLEPVDARAGRSDADPALRGPWPCTTSPACGRGTAPSCAPLVLQAYGAPAAAPFVRALRRLGGRRSTTSSRCGSSSTTTCRIPDPSRRRRPGRARRARRCTTRDRVARAGRRRRRQRTGSSCTAFGPWTDRPRCSRSTRRPSTAAWAWERR